MAITLDENAVIPLGKNSCIVSGSSISVTGQEDVVIKLSKMSFKDTPIVELIQFKHNGGGNGTSTFLGWGTEANAYNPQRKELTLKLFSYGTNPLLIESIQFKVYKVHSIVA